MGTGYFNTHHRNISTFTSSSSSSQNIHTRKLLVVVSSMAIFNLDVYIINECLEVLFVCLDKEEYYDEIKLEIQQKSPRGIWEIR